ncbi:glycosyltransferase family protein [Curtobacterium aurantiacum]|uniref:Glycosyltransferase n=1 Tax=Curtobacterium aurantiacum TaxID=3236919 RepID=A0ABS5VAZ4_9MICO|nr:glycosyltransferase [Curtobacterium flaccumfaciens]MBT1543728.1 glycosyltransferase [Curtobacterium flaccumfaciens pv. flaccumfaciens]MBT1586627.1 glycosyltransferase [Curtobacterium flaccumfaciens pv. flaccumfaciens]
MTPAPGWFGRRRRPDVTASGHPGLEARPASVTAASVVPVTGFPDPLPRLDHDVTVLVTTRSDRHAEVARLVSDARDAFGRGVDVRAVSYVADASPIDPFGRRLPWARPEPVDGLGSAINAGVAAGVGRTLVLVDTSVSVEVPALHALAAAGSVAQARVRMPDGTIRSGARLLRPGALPWSDDRDGTVTDEATVFAADQPVLSVPGAALVPAPCLPDERMTLTAWSRAVADAHGGPVRVLGEATRAVEAGRTVDAATVDAFAAWRDREPEGDGVLAGPPLPPWGARPVSPSARVTGGGHEHLTWSLKIAAPAGPEGDGWGDVHFAAELAGALERVGQRVRVDRRDAHVRDDDAGDDVTLVIRGLDRVPPNPASVNLLWVISHPDDVSDTELRSFDAAFAAGPAWAAAAAARSGVPVRTLLQATDPAVFHPGARTATSPDADRVAFVGSTRGAARPVIADAVALGADLRVHGPGWQGIVPDAALGEPSLSRAEVATAYASARVVLNDHWPDMAAGGFVSNRVFDVLASGGVVVTDPVAGLSDLLDVPTLAVAGSRDDLAALLDPSHAWPTAADRAAVAERIAAEHSFDARAAVLLAAARAERTRLHPRRP